MMHLLDNCRLMAGAPYVLEQNGLAEALEGADLVITGEGRLDRQTLMGKGPGQVIAMARERGIPVAAVCGAIADDFDSNEAGLTQAIAVSGDLPLEMAMDPDRTLCNVYEAVKALVTEMAE